MGINTDKGFIEFRHIRLKDNCITPAITFVFNVNQEENTFLLSFSVCSENDNFSRQVGRDLALNRMKNGFFMECSYNREISLSQNAVDHITSYLGNEKEFVNFVTGFSKNDLDRVDNSLYTIQLYKSIMGECEGMEIMDDVCDNGCEDCSCS